MAKYIHWRWFCRTAKSNGKDLFWSNTQNHSILWWCRTENCPRFIACEVLPYYQKSRNWWLISTRDPSQCISLFFITRLSHTIDWDIERGWIESTFSNIPYFCVAQSKCIELNSLFTKILMPLANLGEQLQNQLARTEIHSPGFSVTKNQLRH